MQLTVRDLIEMFGISEATVTRWVKERALPAQRVCGQLRFNRFELFEWAIAQQIKLENQIKLGSGLVENRGRFQPCESLADALRAGGVHYEVPGKDQETVLREIVSRLPLPEGVDRAFLLQLFVAREALGSTAVGDGIAIPHPRRPIVLHVAQCLVTLCFLKRPLAYRAPDGKPVSVLFSLISPTVTTHVQLLGRLSRALNDPGFRRTVMEKRSREAIVRHASRLDKAEQSAKGARSRAAA